MFIDTHTHIYLSQFDEDRPECIQRAKEQGVLHMYMPNIDSSTIERIKKVSEEFPDVCKKMMGLHPCSVGENSKEELEHIKKEVYKGEYIAVGEIGIDLYWDKQFIKQQNDIFREQIEWSKDLDLPIVIHSRESLDLTISEVRAKQNGELTGVFHCFSGTIEQAQQIVDIGFYLGIGGVLSFKNAGLDKIINEVPLESIVLETDAPYLAPTPYRGKRNESAYLSLIAEKLALALETDVQIVAEQTTKNALSLFKMEYPKQDLKKY